MAVATCRSPSCAREEFPIRKLIDIKDPVERAFLVGAPRKGSADLSRVDEHLDELGRLADTAGAQVIGRMFQRLDKPTPHLYLRAGKGEEVKGGLAPAAATLVPFARAQPP